MITHDSHFVTLRADEEGIWFDLETDTGERAEGCLAWREFHSAYTSWLVSQTETNKLAELDEELKRTGPG